MSLLQVNLMHIGIIGPLLYLIGDQVERKGKADTFLFNALATLTGIIIFIVRPPLSLELTYRNIVNIIHYLVILTFFAWISYKKNNTNINVLKSLKLLGLIVIITHLYLFITKMTIYL